MKNLIALLVLALAVCFLLGMPLLWMLAYYVSWKAAILETVATALLGLVILSFLKTRFEHSLLPKLMAGESPGEELADAVLILLAAILLILPGVLSDLAGLLLLIPPVRWLIVGTLKRRNVV